jgi:ribonuclease D
MRGTPASTRPAAREAVGALSTAHRVPVENLLTPDALRRLAWEPPDPATTEAIAAVLTGLGARRWQAELTARPLADAFATAAAAGLAEIQSADTGPADTGPGETGSVD